MKKSVLICFAVAMIILGFRENSQTLTTPRVTVPAASVRMDPPGRARSLKRMKPVSQGALRAASAKALERMQESQVAWSKVETCASCHHQLLPQIAISLARPRGVPFKEEVAREMTSETFTFFKDLDGAIQGYEFIDGFFDGLSLVSAHATGIAPSLMTDASAQFLASQQLADGSWPTIDVRPPQSHSAFTVTAVCARAVQLFLPRRFKAERQQRKRLAKGWLLKSEPRTTEDRTFQLFGLYWTGASRPVLRKAARALLAQQLDDGGWSQLPGMASDAYATGEVLTALHEAANLPTGDRAYQRGLRFLVRAQKADGTWHIKSRLNPPAPVSPPYFETAFPYGHDQFISITGTAWAAAALMHAIPGKPAASPPSAPHDFEPEEKGEWIRVALSGSAADLKNLLDAGMSPNAATAAGTTALMVAARDIEKVKLLLDRGADVNARAPTGFTALMVASRHRGNSEVVRLLLKAGAKPNRNEGEAVRYSASALFFAVTSGDLQSVRALLDTGARVDERMNLLGRFVVSPLLYATFVGDSAMVDTLIARGASPQDTDAEGVSALSWAAIGNHADTVDVLVARGARVNEVDRLGMTPLLYAASIDFGDTAVIERLVSSGADRTVKTKEGLTALDLTRGYHHTRMTGLLSRER
ncbi:MAG: ankyrin repeat domain-containing protein [Acidobacteria bacterium]|nr:ankyrin repeat domain-containing protein [Acidobacteriota bacterium]